MDEAFGRGTPRLFWTVERMEELSMERERIERGVIIPGCTIDETWFLP